MNMTSFVWVKKKMFVWIIEYRALSKRWGLWGATFFSTRKQAKEHISFIKKVYAGKFRTQKYYRRG